MTEPLSVEQIPPGEAAAIESMICTLKTQLTKRYVSNAKTVLRDAHPKHHGLVAARFVIDENRPVELRHGIFEHARHFEADLRFSNSQPIVNHDLESDIRGFAIKLTGAPLSMLGTNEHDFIFTSGEAFFGRDAVDFVDFPRASDAGGLSVLAYFARPHRLRGFRQLIKAREGPQSPLDVEYFSQTPYRLGPHCVKYQVRPAKRVRRTGLPWYLRDGVRGVIRLLLGLPLLGKWFSRILPGFNALAESLASDLKSEVRLDFLVQRWPDLATMPVWAIEDATRRWSWPWEKVATIRIHTQDSRARHEEGERMVFNPWQVSAIHQPLGSISRARLAIYQAMSDFRKRHSP